MSAGRRESGPPRAPGSLPPLARDAHKGRAGRVLCLAGSPDMPGAAVLAARAAARAGAGLVTVATRDRFQDTIVIGAAPEATLLRLPAAADAPPDFAPAFEEGRFHARLVGPGLGRDRWARAALAACLERASDVPLVLDADALNLLAGEPEALARFGGWAVLTPHPGEAQRLAGRAVPKDPGGRRAVARELAERTGAVVCLKGAGTVVSDGERVFENETGNEGMATAGAGDVLAGMALAYLGRAAASGGSPPDGSGPAASTLWESVCLAVHVHGRAGDLAAEDLGRRAVIASDLIDFLPRAQREVEGTSGA